MRYIPILFIKGYHHIPAASISEEIAANTITCMAPSKTFNLAGLSTSFLVIPDEKLRITYEKKLDQIHVGAGNIFGFVAMEAAYTHGSEWLDQLMEYLEGNLLFLEEFHSAAYSADQNYQAGSNLYGVARLYTVENASFRA